MKKQHLQEVRPEDFNIAALRRAAREGRLFVMPVPECETNVEQEVLAYVSRIAEYAAPPYRECIGEVWRRIVCHPQLSPLISGMKPFNKYAVTDIAIFLCNQGLYTFDKAVALHLLLEGIKKRNKYYTSRAYYAPDTKPLFAILRELKKVLNEEKRKV